MVNYLTMYSGKPMGHYPSGWYGGGWPQQQYEEQQWHQPHHTYQQLPEWPTPEPHVSFPKREPAEGLLPSPPGSSELSSPGTSSPSQQRPQQPKSPYDWMKKPNYQSQPNPVGAAGVAADVCHYSSHANRLKNSNDSQLENNDMEIRKTRTKDKYRVVYTDHQRLELEKEFHYSRYITIRRKAELAVNLGLSERQVKIWFQNRRAKERKQVKKREEVVLKEKGDNHVALQQMHHASVLHHHQQMAMSGMMHHHHHHATFHPPPDQLVAGPVPLL